MGWRGEEIGHAVRKGTAIPRTTPGLLVAATLAVLAHPIPGRADPTTSTIVVQRDPEVMDCPDEPALRRSIAERLGGDPFTRPSLDGWLVDVWFLRPEPGRRSARLLLYEADRTLVGTRFLESREESCDELASTVTMTLAMVLEAELLAASEDGTEGPSPESTSDVASSPSRSEIAETEGAETGSSSVSTSGGDVRLPQGGETPPGARVFGSAQASLGTGFAPKSVLLVGLGGGLRLGSHASLALEGRITSPASISDEDSEARVFLGGGSFEGCYSAGRFAVCASCMVAALVAQGTEGLATERSRSLVVYPAILGSFEQPIARRVALRVRLEVAGAARGVDLEVVGQPLWSSPPVAFAIGVGLTYGQGMMPLAANRESTR